VKACIYFGLRIFCKCLQEKTAVWWTAFWSGDLAASRIYIPLLWIKSPSMPRFRISYFIGGLWWLKWSNVWSHRM